MPKFMTYQRPTHVNRSPAARPGATQGTPAKRGPKPAPIAPEAPRPPTISIRLPGLPTGK